jgi:hypothetical protein
MHRARRPPFLFRGGVNLPPPRPIGKDFVAVSWIRQPSARQSSESGKYSVEHPHRYGRGKTVMQRKLLDIRNSVLDRVVSYLEARNMDTFWIDKACINQTNAKQKAEAMNSMDLVYKNATKSVGLLSIPIYATTGAQMLGRLLNGDLSFEDDSGNFQIYYNVPTRQLSRRYEYSRLWSRTAGGIELGSTRRNTFLALGWTF